MCRNCDDQLFRSITSVLNHVWDKHGVEVVKKWIAKSEDARLPLRETNKKRVSGFRCEECNVSFGNIISLLTHLDRKHGIHIWYERGIAKKRVFFDGILEDTLTEEGRKKREMIPLSKRPLKPRISEMSEDEM